MPPEDSTTLDATRTVRLNGNPLSIDDVAKIAIRSFSVELDTDAQTELRLATAEDVVANAVECGEAIYGVTTGFGGMANQPVPPDQAAALQGNLLSFMATGAGSALDSRHTRAAMLLRANVLLQGCSGVRRELIERLVAFLKADFVPVVRCLGSIGASGDLVPLSTIARAITGHSRWVSVAANDKVIDGADALTELGLESLTLAPKEGLALVNGTSFSSAIAANATYEAKSLMALTFGVQSLMLRSLLAQEEPFEAFVHANKPHPGQVWSARITKRLLQQGRQPLSTTNGKSSPKHVQDRYSLRCLPQYMGPIVESMLRIERTVETEMNAVSDNPLIDVDNRRFYQSGNFLGQYVALAMDDLRKNLGLLAKHLDVQIATLVTPEFSGLPASLRGNPDRAYNMGLKGLQISGNSIMPLLTYYGNPLTDHFPTHAEQFNQNINGLSFGSANLAWNSVELYRQYLSIALLFAVQALDLRAHKLCGHYDGRQLLGSLAQPIYDATLEVIHVKATEKRPLVFDDSDRWLEQDIGQHGQLIESIDPVVQSLRTEFKDATDSSPAEATR